MIPADFDYERAGTVDEAIEMLGDGSRDAKVLAGGHSLLPLMMLRLARPEVLVDIGRIADLSYVRDDGGTIAIGALTRHHDVAHDPVLREHCGLLPEVASKIGDPQVRHRGTIGGATAHGDPASDVPTALVALEAELVMRGPDGERAMPARDFFAGLFTTALDPSEVLTEVRVPKLDGAGWHYEKFTRRKLDWAVVGVAVVLHGDGLGGARVALTNVGETPIRAHGVEEELLDGSGDIDAAARRAAEGTSPPADAEGSPEYRQHLARVLTRRSLEAALAR